MFCASERRNSRLDARMPPMREWNIGSGSGTPREPSGKSVAVDGLEQARLASVIGRFPVVILSPEHGAITSGGPAERRKFMDVTLSQVAAAYLDDVMEIPARPPAAKSNPVGRSSARSFPDCGD